MEHNTAYFYHLEIMDSGWHMTRQMSGTYGRAYGCAYGPAYGPAYGCAYGATYGRAHGSAYGCAYGPAYGCAYGPQWCSRSPVSTARLGWDRAALCERTRIRPGLSRSSCTVDPVDPAGCKEWAKPNFLAPSETPEECAAETLRTKEIKLQGVGSQTGNKFLGWKV